MTSPQIYAREGSQVTTPTCLTAQSKGSSVRRKWENVGNFLTGIVTFEGTGTATPVEVNISSVQMASCMRPQRFLKSEDFLLLKKNTSNDNKEF